MELQQDISYWTTQSALINVLNVYLKDIAQGNFRKSMAIVKGFNSEKINKYPVGLIPRNQNPSLYVLPKGV